MNSESVPVPLYLDHASVAVPELGSAIGWFESRLGLRATRSPAAPERHSRVYLDRSYLEVSVQDPAAGWGVGLFFLRFDDPDALCRHLAATGFDYTFGSYEGVDGTWDDVEVRAGSVPMPILVRRTHPPEAARDWPPPLREPQRCGAQGLDAVVVRVPALRPAAEAYARLVGHKVDELTGSKGQVEIPLAAGRIILAEGEPPGIDGIVLRVASPADTLPVAGPAQQGAIAWLEPATTHGIRFGFVEASPAE